MFKLNDGLQNYSTSYESRTSMCYDQNTDKEYGNVTQISVAYSILRTNSQCTIHSENLHNLWQKVFLWPHPNGGTDNLLAQLVPRQFFILQFSWECMEHYNRGRVHNRKQQAMNGAKIRPTSKQRTKKLGLLGAYTNINLMPYTSTKFIQRLRTSTVKTRIHEDATVTQQRSIKSRKTQRIQQQT